MYIYIGQTKNVNAKYRTYEHHYSDLEKELQIGRKLYLYEDNDLKWLSNYNVEQKTGI